MVGFLTLMSSLELRERFRELLRGKVGESLLLPLQRPKVAMDALSSATERGRMGDGNVTRIDATYGISSIIVLHYEIPNRLIGICQKEIVFKCLWIYYCEN